MASVRNDLSSLIASLQSICPSGMSIRLLPALDQSLLVHLPLVSSPLSMTASSEIRLDRATLAKYIDLALETSLQVHETASLPQEAMPRVFKTVMAFYDALSRHYAFKTPKEWQQHVVLARSAVYFIMNTHFLGDLDAMLDFLGRVADKRIPNIISALPFPASMAMDERLHETVLGHALLYICFSERYARFPVPPALVVDVATAVCQDTSFVLGCLRNAIPGVPANDLIANIDPGTSSATPSEAAVDYFRGLPVKLVSTPVSIAQSRLELVDAAAQFLADRIIIDSLLPMSERPRILACCIVQLSAFVAGASAVYTSQTLTEHVKQVRTALISVSRDKKKTLKLMKTIEASIAKRGAVQLQLIWTNVAHLLKLRGVPSMLVRVVALLWIGGTSPAAAASCAPTVVPDPTK